MKQCGLKFVIFTSSALVPQKVPLRFRFVTEKIILSGICVTILYKKSDVRRWLLSYGNKDLRHIDMKNLTFTGLNLDGNRTYRTFL